MTSDRQLSKSQLKEQFIENLRANGIEHEVAGNQLIITGDVQAKGVFDCDSICSPQTIPFDIQVIGNVLWNSFDCIIGRMTIRGNLSFLDEDGEYVDITELPQQLTVIGDILAANVDTKCQMPEHLFVDGNIELEFSPNISISDNTTITQKLHLLDGYNWTLPEHLTVGYLLAYFTRFERIPETLTVKNDLYLDFDKTLLLPRKLNSANTTIYGDSVEIPENFIALGNLTVQAKIKYKINHMTVTGYLDIGPNTFIPKYLIAGSLFAGGHLAEIPETMLVTGDFTIEECESMDRLPKVINVLGTTDILHYHFFQIPDGFHVRGSLVFDVQRQHCFPRNMIIDGDLTITEHKRTLDDFQYILRYHNLSDTKKKQLLAAWQPKLSVPEDARILGSVIVNK